MLEGCNMIDLCNIEIMGRDRPFPVSVQVLRTLSEAGRMRGFF